MNVQTDDTLHMRYDTDSQSLIITTPKGLNIALNDAQGSITLKDTYANTVALGLMVLVCIAQKSLYMRMLNSL